MSKEKMGGRELGLVLTQKILGMDDLHYGLWDDDLEQHYDVCLFSENFQYISMEASFELLK